MDENTGKSSETGFLPALTLVLGGARSGKSHYAETLVLADAEAMGVRPVYIATAAAGDGDMALRIAEHQARRGERWRTEEALLALADVIDRWADSGRPILIDCLTLWLSNILLAEHDIDGEIAVLLDCLTRAPGPVVCVANEVGLGIVPEHRLGRSFRDHAGRLNQQVAAQADRVEFIAAGLPLTLKLPAHTG